MNNKTDSIENKLNRFYRMAVNAMADGADVAALTQLAFDTFHIPIIVVDVAYRFVACACRQPIADPYWQTIIEQGSPMENTILEYYLNDGLLDSISHCDGAIVVDWGICKDYPQCSGPIYIDKSLEGFVSLLYMEKGKEELALQLNTLLCRLCQIVMRTQGTNIQKRKNPIRELLAHKIFEKAGPGSNELTNAHFDKYKPFVDVIPAYRIYVLSYDTPESNVIEHVRGRIKSVFHDIIYLQRKDSLYILTHHVSPQQTHAANTEIQAFINTYQLHCGCSEIFTDIRDRHVYIEQAETALYCGIHTQSDKRIYHFADYYEEIILLTPVQTLCYENAILAPVRQLSEEDKKNGTDYIHTLYTYLQQRNDIRTTAELLNLHRNTLNYRLTKISDLLNLDINDPNMSSKLHLSLHILKTLKTFTRKPEIAAVSHIIHQGI